METDRLFTRTLVDGLSAFPDHPWSELRKGRTITDIWLAQQLRPFGIRPRSLRLADSVAKGYLLEDFNEIFKRYIPRCEIEALRREILSPQPPPTTPPSSETNATPLAVK